jgi:hypothetical protein
MQLLTSASVLKERMSVGIDNGLLWQRHPE